MFFDEKSEELQELIQLKKQNTKMKLTFENIKITIQQKDNKIDALTAKLSNIQNLQSSMMAFLNQISSLFGINKDQENPFDKIKEIQTQIKRLFRQKEELKEKCDKLTKKIKFFENQTDTERVVEKKDQEIQNLVKEIKNIENDRKKKENLLGEYANRINSLEIAVKQANLQDQNNEKKYEKVKRECLDLAQSICVKHDDYLKAYLLKNNKYQNGYGVSKKNKHNFIFHD